MPDLGATVDMEGASGSPQTLYNPIHASNGGTAIASAQDGDWSDTATWVGGVVPSSSQNAQIKHHVLVDAGALRQIMHIVVEDVGHLEFETGFALKCWTLINNGEVTMGTALAPITGTVTIRNIEHDLDLDPYQFFGGFLSINSSTLTICGTIRNVDHLCYSASVGNSAVLLYTRALSDVVIPVGDGAHSMTLKTEPASVSSLAAATLTGWKSGDRLYFLGCKNTDRLNFLSHVGMEAEYRSASGAPSGNSVTLDSTLSYAHFGQQHQTQAVYRYPKIQNLTRDIVFTSEGTDPATQYRGHFLITQQTHADIRYASFVDMGRSYPTGDATSPHPGFRRGRYPFHVHHIHRDATLTTVDGAGDAYNFYVKGISVYNTFDFREDIGGGALSGPSWGIVIHDSHFGYLGYCDVNWYFGFGIGTEEGHETHNRIEFNRVMFGYGTGRRDDSIGADDGGEAGSCYWFPGYDNFIDDNIAANTLGHAPYQWGFNFYGQHMTSNALITVDVPNRAGVNVHTAAPEDIDTIFYHERGFRSNNRNEVIHCAAAWTQWWCQTVFQDRCVQAAGYTYVDNLCIWGTAGGGYGIFQYESQWLEFRNCISLTLNRGPDGFHNNSVEETDYPQFGPTYSDCLFEGNFWFQSISGKRNISPAVHDWEPQTVRNSILTRVVAATPHQTSGLVTNRKWQVHNCELTDNTVSIITFKLSSSNHNDFLLEDYGEIISYNGIQGDDFYAQRDTVTHESVEYPPLPTLANQLPNRDEIVAFLFAIAGSESLSSSFSEIVGDPPAIVLRDKLVAIQAGGQTVFIRVSPVIS
jgi:hypothetical protein